MLAIAGRLASIALIRRRPLAPGDYYVLLPPADADVAPETSLALSSIETAR